MDPTTEITTMLKWFQDVLAQTAHLPIQTKAKLANQLKGKLIGLKTNIQYFCIGADITIENNFPCQSTHQNSINSDNFSKSNSKNNNSKNGDVRKFSTDNSIDQREFELFVDQINNQLKDKNNIVRDGQENYNDNRDSYKQIDVTSNLTPCKITGGSSSVHSQKLDHTSAPYKPINKEHTNKIKDRVQTPYPRSVSEVYQEISTLPYTSDIEEINRRQQQFNNYSRNLSPKSSAKLVALVRKNTKQQSVSTSNSFGPLSALDDIEINEDNFQNLLCDNFRDG